MCSLWYVHVQSYLEPWSRPTNLFAYAMHKPKHPRYALYSYLFDRARYSYRIRTSTPDPPVGRPPPPLLHHIQHLLLKLIAIPLVFLVLFRQRQKAVNTHVT